MVKNYCDYISNEEIWAASCNACVDLPIDIDPLSIIMSMRQYLARKNQQPPWI